VLGAGALGWQASIASIVTVTRMDRTRIATPFGRATALR